MSACRLSGGICWPSLHCNEISAEGQWIRTGRRRPSNFIRTCRSERKAGENQQVVTTSDQLLAPSSSPLSRLFAAICHNYYYVFMTAAHVHVLRQKEVVGCDGTLTGGHYRAIDQRRQSLPSARSWHVFARAGQICTRREHADSNGSAAQNDHHAGPPARATRAHDEKERAHQRWRGCGYHNLRF